MQLGRASEWQHDTTRRNDFRYDERMGAGYLTPSTILHKLELKASLRGEHTYSVSESPTTGQHVERDYFQLLVGGEYYGPSVGGLYALRSSGTVNLSLRKQLWQEKATLSLKVSDLFYTSGWFNLLRYQNINTDWVNRYNSRRLSLSFTYKLAGGQTHDNRAGSGPTSRAAPGTNGAVWGSGCERRTYSPGLPLR